MIPLIINGNKRTDLHMCSVYINLVINSSKMNITKLIIGNGTVLDKIVEHTMLLLNIIRGNQLHKVPKIFIKSLSYYQRKPRHGATILAKPIQFFPY